MSAIGVGVQVILKEPDDFLKCKETLSRIGVASRKDKKLYQSCHILHKRGEYYICHFKEMFKLDGKPSTISDDDIKRRNLIVSLLRQWGLVGVADASAIGEKSDLSSVKILSYKDKKDWVCESKYTIGKY